MRNVRFWEWLFAIFLNPSFIARKAILDWIKKYSGFLEWRLVDLWCWSKPYREYITVEEYIWVDVEISWHDHANEQIDVFYDWKKLPFDDNSIDSILSTQTFEHIKYLNIVMNDLHRILKSWWYMLVTLPFIWWEHEQPYDFRRYTTFWITHELEEIWFEVIELEKSSTTIITITQLLVNYFRTISTWFPKIIKLIIQILFLGPITISWYLFSFVLPYNDDLYLDNIILVRKK